MKKISIGYYQEIYKGVIIEVFKTEDNNPHTNRPEWYYEVREGKFGEIPEGGQDYYTTKKLCFEMAKDFIDNSEYKQHIGWHYTGEN